LSLIRKYLGSIPFAPFHLCFSLLLYTPLLVLYLHHQQNPFLHSALVIPLAICLAVLALSAAIPRLSERAAGAVDTLVGPVALYTLVSVNIYPFQSGPLDGGIIPVNLISLAGHLLLAAACIFLFLRLRLTAVRILNAIGIFSMIFACYALLKLPPAPPIDNSRLLQAGRSGNVFIIVMDMFQGYFVGNYLKAHPETAARFDGFTYFNNAVSAAPYTTVSTRYLLTGREPHNETGSTRAIDQNDNLFGDAIRNGYQTNYVSVTVPVELPGLTTYSANTSLETKKKDYLQFAYTCCRRFLPAQYLPNIGSPLEFGWISKTNAKDSFRWLTSNLTLDKRIERTFHYYHNIMTHQPIRFTASGQYDKKLTADDIHGEIGFALNNLAEFVDRLKLLGIYDNSTVIISGDHGYNILKEFSERSLPASAAYLREPLAQKMKGQYDVAIMIKPPHAAGALQRTDAAVVLTDLRKTVNELMKPGSGGNLPGTNILQQNLPTERTVTVLSFTGAQFLNEDFDRFDSWKPLKLNIPLAGK